MKPYDDIATQWQSRLERQGLGTFQVLWEIPLQAVDAPNTDRGGWSQVFLLTIEDQDTERKVIVKRQRNYASRTWRHPIKGVPTFRKEFDNIRRCRQLGIAALEAVYYAQRCEGGEQRTILATEFLEGYVPLNKLGKRYREDNQKPSEKIAAIAACAHVVRQMHDLRMAHNHLHPKHVMIRCDGSTIDVRLIDLEGMRHVPMGNRYRIRDLSALYRRNVSWSRSDAMRFILRYLDKQQLDAAGKQFLKRVLNHKRKTT